MSARSLLCLALLSASYAMAASSDFLLGVDYSEWIVPDITQIATDSSGALYIASLNYAPSAPPYFNVTEVTKLSADGKTILWQNNLGFSTDWMAVDPNGGVYVIPVRQSGDTSIYVAKLSADGTGLAWKTPVGAFLSWASPTAFPALAADSQGRTYVAGVHDSTHNEGGVVRLNAAGTAVEYTAVVTGTPNAIAVDGTGAAYVVGSGAASSGGENYLGFLARLAPDGSAGFYSTGPPSLWPAGVAVGPNGDAVALYSLGPAGPGVV